VENLFPLLAVAPGTSPAKQASSRSAFPLAHPRFTPANRRFEQSDNQYYQTPTISYTTKSIAPHAVGTKRRNASQAAHTPVWGVAAPGSCRRFPPPRLTTLDTVPWSTYGKGR